MENKLLNDNELEQAQGGTAAYGAGFCALVCITIKPKSTIEECECVLERR